MNEQHQQHQKNDFDGSDIISQEDRAPTNGNVRQRKKWTKQMNENIIHCFYEITSRRLNDGKKYTRTTPQLNSESVINVLRSQKQLTPITSDEEIG